MENDVKFKVAKVIAEHLDLQQIDENRSFEELGLDELDQIEIVMKVEEVFNIEISDEQVESFVYLKDLVNCVNTMLT